MNEYMEANLSTVHEYEPALERIVETLVVTYDDMSPEGQAIVDAANEPPIGEFPAGSPKEELLRWTMENDRHNIVAAHAEATFKQIKVLNKRRLSAAKKVDRDAIDQEIAQAKADWWQKVAPLMARDRENV